MLPQSIIIVTIMTTITIDCGKISYAKSCRHCSFFSVSARKNSARVKVSYSTTLAWNKKSEIDFMYIIFCGDVPILFKDNMKNYFIIELSFNNSIY